MLGLFLAKIRRKKAIFYYNVYLPKFTESIPLIGRTAFAKNIFKYITRVFSNMCDSVIVPSKAVFKEMIEWGVDKSKIKIVPVGIDRFFVDPSPKEDIAKVKNAYSSPLVLYVGRLSQEKNLELLIYTLDRLLEKYPTAELVVVGRGPEERRLGKLINKLGLNKYVKFKGYLEWQDLKPLYWATDVFCMPSLGETQGISILEAKVCERPCVVLDKVGAGEQIENGVDGLLVQETGDIKKTAFAFASAIDKILSDRSFSTQIGKEARTRALQKTIDVSTKELLQIFDKTLNESIETPNSDIIASVRSFSSFVATNMRYIKEAYFGAVNPKINSTRLKADLHAHPYANNMDRVTNTLDVMIENNVSLLAITVHGMGNSEEKDFWSVKDMIFSKYNPADLEDMDTVLRINYKEKQLYLMPAYEDYCILDGLKGRLDLVIIAPEKDFLSEASKREDFESKMRIARKYKGIVIAAHPYTIWDPHGPKGVIKFRLASPSERRLIRCKVFPRVDCADLVATNCAWMIKSNELLKSEYPQKPICSSDTHAVNRWIRKEIGKSGCILSNDISQMQDGSAIRAYLKQQIISGNFETYLSYLGPIKFILSIALSSPSNKHP